MPASPTAKMAVLRRANTFRPVKRLLNWEEHGLARVAFV